jgi:hypothetical protein
VFLVTVFIEGDIFLGKHIENHQHDKCKFYKNAHSRGSARSDALPFLGTGKTDHATLQNLSLHWR